MKEKFFYIKCTLVGIFTGITVIIYRMSVEAINGWREAFSNLMRNDFKFIYLMGVLLFILMAAALLAYIIKNYTMTRSGGIAPVMADIADNVSFSSSTFMVVKEIFFKLIGGLLALAAGLSFGIEGPSIEMGGEIGQGVGNASNSAKFEKKHLVIAGAAAGLSAAFNAPMSGMMFALEQILKKISLPYIMSIFISTTTVTILTYKVFGFKPYFDLKALNHLQGSDYYLVIIFAFLVSMIGKLFFIISDYFHKINNIGCLSFYGKTLIPITLGIIISIFFFDLTGEGYILANKVMSQILPFKYLFWVFAAKLIYFTYSASTLLPGGSFVPLISIGAIVGNMYGVFLITYFGFPQEFVMGFTVLGMCFLLTAVVRAPMTGVILITEITGETSFFLPLAVGSIVVMFFCEKFKMKPVYNVELENYLAKKREEN